jgi:hypothetical protein
MFYIKIILNRKHKCPSYKQVAVVFNLGQRKAWEKRHLSRRIWGISKLVMIVLPEWITRRPICRIYTERWRAMMFQEVLRPRKMIRPTSNKKFQILSKNSSIPILQTSPPCKLTNGLIVQLSKLSQNNTHQGIVFYNHIKMMLGILI